MSNRARRPEQVQSFLYVFYKTCIISSSLRWCDEKICKLEMKTRPKKTKKCSYTKDCKEQPRQICDEQYCHKLEKVIEEKICETLNNGTRNYLLIAGSASSFSLSLLNWTSSRASSRSCSPPSPRKRRRKTKARSSGRSTHSLTAQLLKIM